MVTTEGNLALFLLTHGRYRSKHDYYVYRAVEGAQPMLEKVRHPEQGLFLNSKTCYFDDDEVGFLRYHASHQSRHDFDAYKIAALRTDDSNPRMSRCNLYTYDSRSTAWDRKTVVLADQRYKGHLATHRSYIVINIGGDAGTMGWVDLEKGIILCDVLGGKEDSPTSRLVRYVPLPDAGPVKKKNTLRGTTRHYRTVAAVHGRIEYVYGAPISIDGAKPMLEKVRHPEPGLFLNSKACYFDDDEVGFLRYRPDDFDAYKIAALRTDDSNPRMSRCNLYTYDSRSTAWDRKTVVLADQRYKGHLATHRSYIVINIGGDAGTMGWVDLEKGIILCDVLGGGKEDSPTTRLVRYIPLPDAGPVKKKNTLRGTTRRYRTVAAVHGRIEYVEVQIHFRPGPRPTRLHGTYFSAGWTVVRWSTTAAAGSSSWRKDCVLGSSDITVRADVAALLPTLPRDIDEDTATLERLHVGHPTISVGDDTGIVYFMAKVDEMEEQAWVMAVDTKRKVLRGVTEFAPRCRYSMEFTYMPTTISKYLGPGTKGNMKRPGMLLPGSSQKKLRPTHPSYGSSCAQNAHNAQVKQEDEGTDYMDLE